MKLERLALWDEKYLFTEHGEKETVLLARPGRFELSLTLAQGSALRPHWGLIHYRTQFESPLSQ